MSPLSNPRSVPRSTPVILPPLSTLRASVQRDKYRADPALWVRERLRDHLWSKQAIILGSIRDHRRTAVHTGYGVGKSWTAARAVAWWFDVHPPGEARVITSAPTGDQVKAILWHEIGRAHAQGNLPGRLNQTEWWMTIPGTDREELVGIGRKPSEHNPAAFQGIHERYVLVVLDEASAIPAALWDAADGLLSNADCRLLSIGNPDDSTSRFAEECKPGSGAHVIHVSAFDTPNFTGEPIPEALTHRLVSPVWVEEKKKRWGEQNPLYISKVLGLFPETTTDGLIPLAWIRAAQLRILDPAPGDPNELGVDVGGGGNRSVICQRRGPIARIISRDHDPDTMKTLGKVMGTIAATNATIARVDKVGIGWGMVDRAGEIAADIHEQPIIRARARAILGVMVGDPASNPAAYVNLRAEGYWGLREIFQDGLIDLDPDDDELAAQLVAIKFTTPKGRTQIESKKEMKARGMPSPDDADALMLAFLRVAEKTGMTRATWGKRRRRQ